MLFSFCPRLQRFRLSATSSNSETYHLNTPSPPSSLEPDQHPDPPRRSSSSEYVDAPRHQRGSSSGLSDRLRKRFSREGKAFQPASKNNPDIKQRTSILPFSKLARFSRGPVVPSGEVGSSLMSERGYDSDAQFIGTPKGAASTPVDQGCNNGRLGVVPEEHPRLDSEACRGPRDGNRRSALGSGHSARRPIPSMHCYPSSEYLDDHDPPPPSPSAASPAEKISLTDSQKSGANASANADRSVTPRTITSPLHTMIPSPSMSFSMENERQVSSGPSRVYHTSPRPSAYKSSDSGAPSELYVSKRRRQPLGELMSEAQSVHLGEMGIPRMLASPSMSHRYLSQSLDENPWNSNPASRSVSFRSCSAANQAPEPPAWYQGSSVYSPGNVTSDATGCSTGAPNQYSPDNPACRNHYLAALSPGSSARWDEALQVEAGQDGPLQSKFTERFASNSSIGSLQSNLLGDNRSNPAFARKVSEGWLTQGRRIGYGYSMVSGEGGGSFMPDRSHSTASSAQDNASKHANHPTTNEDSNSQASTKQEETKPSIMHHVGSRHGSGHSEGTHSVWDRIASRKKAHAEEVDSPSPWSHFCGVGLEQASEHESSAAPPPTVVEVSKRAAGLQRAKSLWTRSRKAPYPVIQRQVSRVAKFRVRARARGSDEGTPRRSATMGGDGHDSQTERPSTETMDSFQDCAEVQSLIE